MGKKQQASEDTYGQAAGAIGGLAIAFGVLAAIKDKLGLSWPATVLLTAGALVALGYGAWKLKATIRRLWAGEGSVTAALRQEAPDRATHEQESAAESRARAPGADRGADHGRSHRQGRRSSAPMRPQSRTVPTGTRYDFLLPKGRTVRGRREAARHRRGATSASPGCT